MDITQVKSLLEQVQQSQNSLQGGRAKSQARESSLGSDFADLLKHTSSEQKASEKAFEKYAVEGQGELHDVMTQMAKADVTFRFLLEVRNKLTEAYQELARLQV